VLGTVENNESNTRDMKTAGKMSGLFKFVFCFQ